jgi:hypothetical protein
VTRGALPAPKLNRRQRRVFWAVAGGLLGLTFFLHFWYFPRFSGPAGRERPRRVEGRVIRKDTSRDQDGREVVRVTYRFRTTDRRSVEGQASETGKRLGTLRLGDRVWVLYSESDPRRNRLAAGDAPPAAPAAPGPNAGSR